MHVSDMYLAICILDMNIDPIPSFSIYSCHWCLLLLGHMRVDNEFSDSPDK